MSVERKIRRYLEGLQSGEELDDIRWELILRALMRIKLQSADAFIRARHSLQVECLNRKISVPVVMNKIFSLSKLVLGWPHRDRETFVLNASRVIYPGTRSDARYENLKCWVEEKELEEGVDFTANKRPWIQNKSVARRRVEVSETPSTMQDSDNLSDNSPRCFADASTPRRVKKRTRLISYSSTFDNFFGFQGSRKRDIVDAVTALYAVSNGAEDDILRSESPAVIFYLICGSFEEAGEPYQDVSFMNTHCANYKIIRRDLALKCFRKQTERAASTVSDQLFSAWKEVAGRHQSGWLAFADIQLGDTCNFFGLSERLDCFKALCAEKNFSKYRNKTPGLDLEKLRNYLAAYIRAEHIPQLTMSDRLSILKDFARPACDLVERALEKIAGDQTKRRYNEKLPQIASQIVNYIESQKVPAQNGSVTDSSDNHFVTDHEFNSALESASEDDWFLTGGISPTEQSVVAESDSVNSSPPATSVEMDAGFRSQFFNSTGRRTRSNDFADIIQAGLEAYEVKRIPVSEIDSKEKFALFTNGASCPVVLIAELEEPAKSVVSKETLESRLKAENPQRYTLLKPSEGKLSTSGIKSTIGKLEGTDWALFGNARMKYHPSPLDTGGQLADLIANQPEIVRVFTGMIESFAIGTLSRIENQLFISKSNRPYTINIHLDEYANLYRCLSGQKLWTVFQPVLESKLLDSSGYHDSVQETAFSEWNGRRDPQGFVRHEIALSPGHWLYVPPRWPHQVESSNARDELCVAINYIYPFKNEIPVTRTGALEYLIPDEQLRVWKGQGLTDESLAIAIFEYIKHKK